MSYEIDRRKVMGVILETDTALKGMGFNEGEVIVGLSELIGKIIVRSGRTPIQMEEMKQVVFNHLERTIHHVSQATENTSLYRG
mgnify:CR=1 FL=1